MTGIERLRALAAARDEWILGGTLADIAEQIERERECERDTIENLRLELGEACDEAAWVREHGGLESVKERLDWVVGHCSTKQQLDFDFWLSGRVMHELGFDEDMADRDEVERRLLARLMPEGMEWPRYEDGARLAFEDELPDFARTIYKTVKTVKFQADGTAALTNGGGSANVVVIVRPGERVKRPAPKVLAADGEPLEVGQTVYFPDGTLLHVTGVGNMTEGHQTVFGKAGNDITDDEWDAVLFTHQRPVLDADGVPIKKGDTVYFTDGREQECNTVVHAKYDYKDEPYVQFGRLNEAGYPTYTNCSCIDPSQLTHERPDSWERLERDANASTCTYFGATTKDCEICGHVSWECSYDKARDLVRRCRALAKRERSES